jgi:hypothetical protein
MTTGEFRRRFEKVQAELNAMLGNPVAFSDRLRWLGVLDVLDGLKEDLLGGGGKAWPSDFRGVYVKVRTGIKELFDLLFAGPDGPPVAYALGRLTVYRDRVADAVAKLAPAAPAT